VGEGQRGLSPLFWFESPDVNENMVGLLLMLKGVFFAQNVPNSPPLVPFSPPLLDLVILTIDPTPVRRRTPFQIHPLVFPTSPPTVVAPFLTVYIMVLHIVNRIGTIAYILQKIFYNSMNYIYNIFNNNRRVRI